MTNFFCNYACDYCYLGSLRKDPSIINLELLQKQLCDISEKYGKIEKINLYGGEITILDKDFIIKIVELCKQYATTNIITNLSDPIKISEIIKQTNCEYATSINEERDCYDETLFNLMLVEKRPTTITQVVTPSLLKKSPKEILKQAESFNTEYIEFLQYFPSKTNDFCFPMSKTPNRDYSNFLRDIIEEYWSKNYRVKIENVEELEQVVNGEYTPWMDNAIFITPRNEYAVVEYFNSVENPNLEKFTILKDLDEYDEKCKKEKIIFGICPYCHYNDTCEYYGYCYAEHLRARKKGDSCPGHYGLVKWYARKREENLYKID
jgi:MoaA/NifB/PqqE/SkfB family radical SAM enzyme